MIGVECKKSVFHSDNAHDTSDVSERNVARRRKSELDRMDFRHYVKADPIGDGLSEKEIAF